jgi:hypothetical protein
LVDKFAAIIDALTEVSKNDASLIGFVVGVSAEARRHPELSDAIRPLRKDWAMFFQQLCENAVARGEVGSEMTARTLQDLFDVMISGLARFAYVINDREREEKDPCRCLHHRVIHHVRAVRREPPAGEHDRTLEHRSKSAAREDLKKGWQTWGGNDGCDAGSFNLEREFFSAVSFREKW